MSGTSASSTAAPLCASRRTASPRYYPEGESQGGIGRYYHRDHLGSVRAVSDDAGSLEAAYAYDPWGRRTTLLGNSAEVDFGYTGHFTHHPTGLALAPYRAYDPDLGRWISRDPIGEEGGLNVYVYVGNDPINFIDRFGLETTVITVRDNGFGTHAAVHVDKDGYGQPFLYDPAGSFIPPSREPRGSGDFFVGADANIDDFIKFHENVGSTVEITKLPTMPAQEAEIARRAETIGGVAPFLCARAVSKALGGICSIGEFFFPGSLASGARGATCP